MSRNLVVYQSPGGSWVPWTAQQGGGGGGGAGGNLRGFVGAYINPTVFGSGFTVATAVQQFQSITGIPLKARRVYYGPAVASNKLPAGPDNGLKDDVANRRKSCISMRPAFNPVSTDDRTAISNFLVACKAIGVIADVALYPEPNNCSTAADGTMTAALYKAAVAFYGPTIQASYPLVHCTSAFFDQHSDPAHTYYPGDGSVDKITTDIYTSEFDGGTTLAVSMSVADQANPPKPFGVWEFNSSSQQTLDQSNTFDNYLQSQFATRLATGKQNADVLLFNSNTLATQETPIISASDPRIPAYLSLVTAISK